MGIETLESSAPSSPAITEPVALMSVNPNGNAKAYIAANTGL